MASPPVKEAAPPKEGAVADEKDAEKSQTWMYTNYATVAIAFCMIAGAALCMYLGWTSFVSFLFNTVESSEHKTTQAIVINSVLVVMIVCCLPGPALMVMMDGFFFGFFKGFALGFLGESIGYLISIALARTCFKSRMRVWLHESDMLREVLTVCEEDTTGKFLVLFRFISLPVWAKNYTIGMLEISWLKSYLIFIPGECFYAAIFSYIGSKGHVIADAIRKGNSQKALDSFSGLELAIVGVSILGGGMMILLGWREYTARRDAIAEGAKAESTPLKSA